MIASLERRLTENVLGNLTARLAVGETTIDQRKAPNPRLKTAFTRVIYSIDGWDVNEISTYDLTQGINTVGSISFVYYTRKSILTSDAAQMIDVELKIKRELRMADGRMMPKCTMYVKDVEGERKIDYSRDGLFQFPLFPVEEDHRRYYRELLKLLNSDWLFNPYTQPPSTPSRTSPTR